MCGLQLQTAGTKGRGPLQPIVSGYPMQIVAVDIHVSLPVTERGNRYVLVAADYFTRWMKAWPIPNQEAKTVADFLTKEMFYWFAIPEQLHSNQGCLSLRYCRRSAVCSECTRPIPPGHPQSDGLVERFNRTLLNMLSIVTKDHHQSWDIHLREICFAYNTSIQPSHQFSPFFLMFGRQPKPPVDLGYHVEDNNPVSTNEYTARVVEKLDWAFEQHTMSSTQDRQKALYNRKIHGAPYNVSDHVFLFSQVVKPGQSRNITIHG